MDHRGDVTIYDVARAAGVSPSTVSRALSKPGRVSYGTAERIRAVAAELGYRSRSIRREMAPGGGVLMLVVADLTNPVFASLLRGAQRAAEDAGHSLVVTDTQGSVDAEESLLSRLVPDLDGILLASSRMNDASIRKLAKQAPVVVMNRVVSDVRSISPDYLQGLRRAAELLGDKGHRTITYLAGPTNSWADGMRWRGLREAAVELEQHAVRVGPGHPTMAGGAQAYGVWKRHQTSAVVAYNDLMAIGFIEAARRDGLAAPKDFSIIGFDNIVNGAQMTPALTTLAAPVATLGVVAVQQLLFARRSAAQRAPKLLPVRLVLRQSVAMVPPGTGDE